MSLFSPITQGFLFTDFYQLTMAQVYFNYDLHLLEAQFEYFFRSYPNYGQHQAGFCIFAGLETFFQWLNRAKPTPKDLDYLKTLTSRNKKPLFSPAFLDWLAQIDFRELEIKAIPEGRAVHPYVPLVTVKGPFALAQLIETPLLNTLNYQTLIATKAARIKEAAWGQTVMDFGLRRAQWLGGNAGTRAALIGGVEFSSNVGTSSILNLPPKGTHAHSLVQAFMALGYSEEQAFEAFAQIFPDDCILLIDTINTLESGLPNAIKIFQKLQKKGHKPLGIRIDSGDLAYLAVQCYLELKKAHLEDCLIILSNQLDELVIQQIITQIKQEAHDYHIIPEEIISKLVFGTGTRLITSAGCCSLDGVYKLTAIKKHSDWEPALKISDSPSKLLIPGEKKTYRLTDKRNKYMVDLICLETEELPFNNKEFTIFHPQDSNVFRTIQSKDIAKIELLQIDIQKNGQIVYDFPDLKTIQKQKEKDLEHLDKGVKRLIKPHNYHVSITKQVYALREKLLKKYQNKS
ncbi:MAG: nicotinate phosphoribosyltransferase [Desulfonauticus sp.]|nr:nicotinate phosphoribosyltransferase [Desulfonauticus sp.]